MTGELLAELVTRIRESGSVTDVVSAIVLSMGPVLRLKGLGFLFFGTNNAPTLAVTNWCPVDQTRDYMTHVYRKDPLLHRVLATRTSASFGEILTIEELHALRSQGVRDVQQASIETLKELANAVMVPLAGVGELVGAIQFWPLEPADAGSRDLMNQTASIASLRLAQIGVVCPVYSSELGCLTPRQMEIVELVIRGDANHEVAAELGISVNTVKKMLRLVFDALGVTTRTELAARVNRALPHIGHARLPDGYTMVAIDPQTGATKTWG